MYLPIYPSVYEHSQKIHKAFVTFYTIHFGHLKCGTH